MSHGHGHGTPRRDSRRRLYPAPRSGTRADRGYMVVQVVVSLTSGSLALLSDAAHMGTDVLGLGAGAGRGRPGEPPPAASQRTYGNYRLEVLAAVINGLLLFGGAAAYVFVEAIQRIADPPPRSPAFRC